MPDIVHKVEISCDFNKVYKAPTSDEGLSTWWINYTKAVDDIGSIIELRFNGDGPDFEVLELVPDKLVRWQHAEEMTLAWMGTEVAFRLSDDTGKLMCCFLTRTVKVYLILWCIVALCGVSSS